MTIKEIQDKVKKIEELAQANNYEDAHALEDNLYREFVNSLANFKTRPHPQVIAAQAAAVAKTQNLDFARYTA